MLVVVGGSYRIYFGSSTKENYTTAITFENIYGAFSFEGMIYAKFALAFIKSECFECFYEHYCSTNYLINSVKDYTSRFYKT